MSVKLLMHTRRRGEVPRTLARFLQGIRCNFGMQRETQYGDNEEEDKKKSKEERRRGGGRSHHHGRGHVLQHAALGVGSIVLAHLPRLTKSQETGEGRGCAWEWATANSGSVCAETHAPPVPGWRCANGHGIELKYSSSGAVQGSVARAGGSPGSADGPPAC